MVAIIYVDVTVVTNVGVISVLHDQTSMTGMIGITQIDHVHVPYFVKQIVIALYALIVSQVDYVYYVIELKVVMHVV